MASSQRVAAGKSRNNLARPVTSTSADGFFGIVIALANTLSNFLQVGVGKIFKFSWRRLSGTLLRHTKQASLGRTFCTPSVASSGASPSSA
jgi:hypothetical protein